MLLPKRRVDEKNMSGGRLGRRLERYSLRENVDNAAFFLQIIEFHFVHLVYRSQTVERE